MVEKVGIDEGLKVGKKFGRDCGLGVAGSFPGSVDGVELG